MILPLLSMLLIAPDAHGQVLKLSVSESLKLALSENKTLTLFSFDEEIAEDRLSAAEGIYDPFFRNSFVWSKQDLPSRTLSSVREDDLSSIDATLGLKNPIGGISSLNAFLQRDFSRLHTGLYPLEEYSSGVSLRYEQPVMRGFGRDITELEIEKARINKEFSAQQSADARSHVLFNVYKACMALYNVMGELEIKREIRENSENIYWIVKEKFEMRKLTITDLKKIEATVLLIENEMVKLENSMRQRFNDFLYAIYSDARIGRFSRIDLTSSLEELGRYASGLDMRDTAQIKEELDLEMLRLKSELDLFEGDLRKAIDEKRPDFIIAAEAGFSGFDPNDPGQSVSSISPSNYRVALKGTLSLPIRNTTAKSRLAEINKKVKQQLIKIENRRTEIEKAVNELFDSIETAEKNIKFNQKLVSITEENLRNEQERLIAEKSTLLDTLQFQTDFSNAKLALLQSKIDYLLLIGTSYLFRRQMEVFIDK